MIKLNGFDNAYFAICKLVQGRFYRVGFSQIYFVFKKKSDIYVEQSQNICRILPLVWDGSTVFFVICEMKKTLLNYENIDLEDI